MADTWEDKLLSLSVVLLVTIYFWSLSERRWFYGWLDPGFSLSFPQWELFA